MLECRDLSCGYEKKIILSDINLKFAPGGVIALLGVNGSGKSTLLRTLGRLSKPLKGGIFLDDNLIEYYKPRAFARKVAFLPQFREAPALSVQMLVRHGRFPWLGFARRFSAQDYKITQYAMERTGVLPLRDRSVRALSGGERQRCYIAMLLAQEADILLLDEPTAALDIAYQFEIMNLIASLGRNGKTVIIAIHELSLALAFCDDFIALDAGKVCFHGGRDALLKKRVLQKAFHIEILSSGGYWLCVPEGDKIRGANKDII